MKIALFKKTFKPQHTNKTHTHAHYTQHTTHTQRLTHLPVASSKLFAVPIRMSGYQRCNFISFLSCKIHCAEPPPSNTLPSPPFLLHPASSSPTLGGVNLSVSLYRKKCSLFSCSRKYKRKKRSQGVKGKNKVSLWRGGKEEEVFRWKR